MCEIIPLKLNMLADALKKPLYVVGGICRDFIAGLKLEKRDWDICAPLCAETVEEAARKVGFTVNGVYKNTGTVKMSCDGEEYEFTSFRTDRYVRGEHSPAEVYFTEDITLDARRRDFKCNAVYYDISACKFVDPLGGIEEIKRGVISTVAPAEKVFGEDGLRLMRLARIAAQTGFTPTEECIAGAFANRALIADIHAERVWAELDAILHADSKYGVKGAPYAGLKLLDKIGVLDFILPELAEGRGMAQRSDYHSHDVLEHSLRCVAYAPPQIRLAALLHDTGKPYCMNYFGRYARHEEEGERIAEEICNRLHVAKSETKRVCKLVKLHMYDLSGQASINKVRKFIVANYEYIDDLLLLKQADFSACKDDLSEAPCVTKWKKVLSDMQMEGVPLTLKQLNVRGNELIDAGICPDQTGKALAFLLGECAIGNVDNDREKLIKFALSRKTF
ncbi:MAG: HD domain-containing protein [Clostridia bacterium]|nr:HD domain-containing protein [Clostridia bacterium]